MLLKDFKRDFLERLSNIYPITEIDTFFFLLIEEYLGLQRIDTVLKPNFKIEQKTLQILQSALKRLKKEEPIQYIIGKTEFYGFPFLVNKNTLIPRPETEELVAWILKEITEKKQDLKPLQILDIGTGTGCIPICLAKNLPNAIITAIDVSKDALKVAKKNAELNTVTINFIELDVLKTEKLFTRYDVIVSNPPYVRALEKVEIQNNVLKNEPHLALFVDDDNPLVFYDKIANLAKKHLYENGVLFFEINQYLGKETIQLLQHKEFQNIELRKDIFQNNRMIKAALK